jgi:hypothetical protein
VQSEGGFLSRRPTARAVRRSSRPPAPHDLPRSHNLEVGLHVAVATFFDEHPELEIVSWLARGKGLADRPGLAGQQERAGVAEAEGLDSRDEPWASPSPKATRTVGSAR